MSYEDDDVKIKNILADVENSAAIAKAVVGCENYNDDVKNVLTAILKPKKELKTAEIAMEGIFDTIITAIKRIIDIIINTCSNLITSYVGFIHRAKSYTFKANLLQNKAWGIDLGRGVIKSNQLMSQLAIGKNIPKFPGQAYRATVDSVIDIFKNTDIKTLQDSLATLALVSDDKINKFKEHVHLAVSKQCKSVLNLNKNPGDLGLDGSSISTALYTAGPYMGNRFIYANIPFLAEDLEDYVVNQKIIYDVPNNNGNVRCLNNIEVKDILKSVLLYSDEMITFANTSLKVINSIKNECRVLKSRNINDKRALHILSNVPKIIKGLHTSMMYIANSNTDAVLVWISKSIIAAKTLSEPNV